MLNHFTLRLSQLINQFAQVGPPRGMHRSLLVMPILLNSTGPVHMLVKDHHTEFGEKLANETLPDTDHRLHSILSSYHSY